MGVSGRRARKSVATARLFPPPQVTLRPAEHEGPGRPAHRFHSFPAVALFDPRSTNRYFFFAFLGYCNCACAAARRAIGTRNGEQLT